MSERSMEMLDSMTYSRKTSKLRTYAALFNIQFVRCADRGVARSRKPEV